MASITVINNLGERLKEETNETLNKKDEESRARDWSIDSAREIDRAIRGERVETPADFSCRSTS